MWQICQLYRNNHSSKGTTNHARRAEHPSQSVPPTDKAPLTHPHNNNAKTAQHPLSTVKPGKNPPPFFSSIPINSANPIRQQQQQGIFFARTKSKEEMMAEKN